MLSQIITLFTMSFFWTTLIIGFFIIKGGFEKKYLFTDNFIMAVVVTIISGLIHAYTTLSLPVVFFIVIPFFTFVTFVLLFFYRFFRNPRREIEVNERHVLSPADGRIVYIKELEESTFPVSIKKRNMIRLDEITKTDMLKTPCYLVGIAMTLFDVHINRSPVEGKTVLIQHTDGDALGLRNPDSPFVNERNTVVIEDKRGRLFGVIQIAARGVRRCIVSVENNTYVKQGQIIGKIRFGSQVDMIFPRDYVVQVREGDQVHAGTSVIAAQE